MQNKNKLIWTPPTNQKQGVGPLSGMADKLKSTLPILQDQALVNKQGMKESEAFRKLAEQRLGNMNSFNQAQQAQQELASRAAAGQNIAAQRLAAGQLAGQGVRGGAARAAQVAQMNQGSQIQSDITRKMIVDKAAKEQELRQQLLAAELAGRQFGGSQAQTLIGQRLQANAAQEAQKAQSGTVLCTLAWYNGDLSYETLQKDGEYGYGQLNPYSLIGYRLWAVSLVDIAFKHKTVYNLIKPFIQSYANEISGDKPNLTGKIVKAVGEPVCYIIGRVWAFTKGL